MSDYSDGNSMNIDNNIKKRKFDESTVDSINTNNANIHDNSATSSSSEDNVNESIPITNDTNNTNNSDRDNVIVVSTKDEFVESKYNEKPLLNKNINNNKVNYNDNRLYCCHCGKPILSCSSSRLTCDDGARPSRMKARNIIVDNEKVLVCNKCGLYYKRNGFLPDNNNTTGKRRPRLINNHNTTTSNTTTNSNSNSNSSSETETNVANNSVTLSQQSIDLTGAEDISSTQHTNNIDSTLTSPINSEVKSQISYATRSANIQQTNESNDQLNKPNDSSAHAVKDDVVSVAESTKLESISTPNQNQVNVNSNSSLPLSIDADTLIKTVQSQNAALQQAHELIQKLQQQTQQQHDQLMQMQKQQMQLQQQQQQQFQNPKVRRKTFSANRKFAFLAPPIQAATIHRNNNTNTNTEAISVTAQPTPSIAQLKPIHAPMPQPLPTPQSQQQVQQHITQVATSAPKTKRQYRPRKPKTPVSSNVGNVNQTRLSTDIADDDHNLSNSTHENRNPNHSDSDNQLDHAENYISHENIPSNFNESTDNHHHTSANSNINTPQPPRPRPPLTLDTELETTALLHLDSHNQLVPVLPNFSPSGVSPAARHLSIHNVSQTSFFSPAPNSHTLLHNNQNLANTNTHNNRNFHLGHNNSFTPLHSTRSNGIMMIPLVNTLPNIHEFESENNSYYDHHNTNNNYVLSTPHQQTSTLSTTLTPLNKHNTQQRLIFDQLPAQSGTIHNRAANTNIRSNVNNHTHSPVSSARSIASVADINDQDNNNHPNSNSHCNSNNHLADNDTDMYDSNHNHNNSNSHNNADPNNSSNDHINDSTFNDEHVLLYPSNQPTLQLTNSIYSNTNHSDDQNNNNSIASTLSMPPLNTHINFH